ncbi:unnamed protein product [Schistosoma margrebowiei]|uniref:Uncharacterized protein n=1 Tax=Schistosoma margrebowiei TaxID=48269 RepID=A0A183M6G6_9TREM|nr:unnamed protein product [Schistosoma margrebowiei]
MFFSTLQIRELTYILQNFSRSSIILIDGLCQNTDPDEVEYLNWAICEALLEHKAFTFLATNRYELTSLASFYPNVEKHKRMTITKEGMKTEREIGKILMIQYKY